MRESFPQVFCRSPDPGLRGDALGTRQFRPKVVHPCHCRSDDDTKAKFKQLRKDGRGVEIRVRDSYSEK
jgi:hypothetical protein